MTGRRELSWALASVTLLFLVASGLGGVVASSLGLRRPAADVAAAWVLQTVLGALGFVGRRRLVSLGVHMGEPGEPKAGARWVLHALWFGTVLVLVQAAVNTVVQLTARVVGWGELVRRIGLEEQRSLVALLLSSRGAWLVALLVLLVAVAPVSEELFFRGYLYCLLRRLGQVPPLPAAAASALVFAGLHAYLVHLPALWVVGVLLALWYERTGRLASAIGAHAVANVLTLALALAGRTPAGS